MKSYESTTSYSDQQIDSLCSPVESETLDEGKPLRHKRDLSRRAFLGLAGVGILGAALGLAGCGDKANAATPGTQSDAKTVRIGYCGDVGNVTLQYTAGIAAARGFIDEELGNAGYKAEYVGFPQAGPAVNEAFAANSIDFALYSEMPAITIRSKGVDVKAFAVVDSRQAFAILASDKSGIQDVQGLRGKKVAVAYGTVPQRYLLLTLQKAGISPDELELINATAQDAPTMVASAGADACVGMFTTIHENAKKGGSHIIATSLEDPELSTTANFFSRGEYLAQNREAAIALTKALKRGFEYAKQNPDEARQILADAGSPRDAVDAEFADDTFPGFDPEITDEVKAKYQGVEQFLLDGGLIKQHVDVNDLIDTSIYQDA